MFALSGPCLFAQVGSGRRKDVHSFLAGNIWTFACTIGINAIEARSVRCRSLFPKTCSACTARHCADSAPGSRVLPGEQRQILVLAPHGICRMWLTVGTVLVVQTTYEGLLASVRYQDLFIRIFTPCGLAFIPNTLRKAPFQPTRIAVQQSPSLHRLIFLTLVRRGKLHSDQTAEEAALIGKSISTRRRLCMRYPIRHICGISRFGH